MCSRVISYPLGFLVFWFSFFLDHRVLGVLQRDEGNRQKLSMKVQSPRRSTDGYISMIDRVPCHPSRLIADVTSVLLTI